MEKLENFLFGCLMLLLLLGVLYNVLDLYRFESKHWEGCLCGDDFHGEHIQLRSPEEREEEILDQVLEAHQLDDSSYVLCSTAYLNGATAYARFMNGKKYIVYDRGNFVNRSYIKAVRVIGHEVGHHVYQHTRHRGDDRLEELEADEFSGESLYLLGYSKDESIETMSTSYMGSDIHSKGPVRRDAIRKGWELARRFQQKYSPSNRQVPSVVMENKEYAIVTVASFIESLGQQKFRAAYQLQRIKH